MSLVYPLWSPSCAMRQGYLDALQMRRRSWAKRSTHWRRRVAKELARKDKLIFLIHLLASSPSQVLEGLHFGPATMCHLSSQIHWVDAQIRQLVSSLPTSPPGALTAKGEDQPTLATVVAAQRAMSNRLEHISRRQGKIEKCQWKFREHKKKSKHRSLRGSSSSNSDEDWYFPTRSSSSWCL